MVLHRKFGTGQTDVLVALSWISFFQKLSRVSHLERKSYGYRISQSLEVALHGSGRASKSDASKHGSSLVPTCRRALSELRDSKWFQDLPVWKILCYPFVIPLLSIVRCFLPTSNCWTRWTRCNSLQLVTSACDLRRPVTEPETGAAAQQDAVGALGRCRISLGDAMHMHYMHYMHLHYMHSFRCNANCHGETSLGNTEWAHRTSIILYRSVPNQRNNLSRESTKSTRPKTRELFWAVKLFSLAFRALTRLGKRFPKPKARQRNNFQNLSRPQSKLKNW